MSHTSAVPVVVPLAPISTVSELLELQDKRFPGRSSRCVTEAAVRQFALEYGDFNPIHTDYNTGHKSVFGRCVAHGQLVSALTMGMAFETFERIELQTILKREKVDYLEPVFPGDEIRIMVTFKNFKVVESGKSAFAFVRLQTINQHGMVVVETELTILMVEGQHH